MNDCYHPFPAEWSDEQIVKYLVEDNHFLAVRKLKSGEWIGLLKLAFTLSVCMEIQEISCFTYRWCFEDPDEAIHFFVNAKEFDEVPTKRTSLRGHRYARAPLLTEYDERGFAKW